MGGDSSSASTVDNSTDISTITTTEIGEIGLTGSDAVELAAVISEGIAFNTQKIADVTIAQARDFDRSPKKSKSDPEAEASEIDFITLGFAAILGVIIISQLARGKK